MARRYPLTKPIKELSTSEFVELSMYLAGRRPESHGTKSMAAVVVRVIKHLETSIPRFKQWVTEHSRSLSRGQAQDTDDNELRIMRELLGLMVESIASFFEAIAARKAFGSSTRTYVTLTEFINLELYAQEWLQQKRK